MKKTQAILAAHGISSVLMNGVCFAKTQASHFGISFLEYEKVEPSEVYEYLGY